MTAQRYVHDILQPHVLPLMQRLPGAIFQYGNARAYTASASQDSSHCYYLSLACSISRFVTNRAYWDQLDWRWTFPEFERSRGKVTTNLEGNVSRRHTELYA
ncbi:transposable element Tcb1 transposase [Trichonephila clavipes]|nr:transposable element Tcb1 transposase [Trichonephila clavipes]